MQLCVQAVAWTVFCMQRFVGVCNSGPVYLNAVHACLHVYSCPLHGEVYRHEYYIREDLTRSLV